MRFEHGRFFGEYQQRRDVGDVAMAELRPTVPEHDVVRHTHDDAHFLLLLEGAYLSTARGMPPVCRTSALVLNPPGTTHRDCFRGVAGLFFTVSLPAGAWRAAIERRDLPHDPLRLPGRAFFRAARLCRELRSWDSASPLAVESGLEELLDAASAHHRTERGGPAWLERARERLRDECRHAPNLGELARLAGVHPVYFARAFRRCYGCSPGDYLRRCRMDLALSLIHRRGPSLREIAAHCGFVDQAHLSHAFSAAFGLPPSRFRAEAG